MSDIITQIILASCKRITDDAEWEKSCKHWEFYPITCSPINGVEGRKELFKQYPEKEAAKKGKAYLEEIKGKSQFNLASPKILFISLANSSGFSKGNI